MKDQPKNQITFDTYRIGGVTYIKDTYLGPKTWGIIEAKQPGKFVDILEAKFAEKALIKKIDINK